MVQNATLFWGQKLPGDGSPVSWCIITPSPLFSRLLLFIVIHMLESIQIEIASDSLTFRKNLPMNNVLKMKTNWLVSWLLNAQFYCYRWVRWPPLGTLTLLVDGPPHRQDVPPPVAIEPKQMFLQAVLMMASQCSTSALSSASVNECDTKRAQRFRLFELSVKSSQICIIGAIPPSKRKR